MLPILGNMAGSVLGLMCLGLELSRIVGMLAMDSTGESVSDNISGEGIKICQDILLLHTYCLSIVCTLWMTFLS